MSGECVLITSVFLKPGDEVDQLLQSEGLRAVYAPLTGHRSEAELARLLVGIEGVVAGSDPFTAEVIGGAPQLRVIARTGVGYDAIDVAAATLAGVAVANVPGVNRRSVAELALAFLLLCARRIPENMADVRSGGWARLSGRELGGSTLGIVGLGAIGKSVALITKALGMRVVAYDPHLDSDFAKNHGIEAATMDAVLTESDFVSLHMFLNESTRHLIDASAIAKMKRTAYLINTSRGPIVDEAALVAALEAGAIAGAALDVVESEPLPPDSPLRQRANVILTAHIGGATMEARDRSGIAAAHSVINVLRGKEPLNVVNPDYVGGVTSLSDGQWGKRGA